MRPWRLATPEPAVSSPVARENSVRARPVTWLTPALDSSIVEGSFTRFEEAMTSTMLVTRIGIALFGAVCVASCGARTDLTSASVRLGDFAAMAAQVY